MNANVEALLRFLSQDAKVPLALAMSKVKELQKAQLDTPERLSKVKTSDIASMFVDEKIAKQILTAAKRVSKKRAAGDDVAAASPRKKQKGSVFSEDVVKPAELEASLTLPIGVSTEEELSKTVIFTNRAPLVLAFAVTLLKHTMPEQPLSSRLSLAQGYVSTTSRARAVSLGIQELSREQQAQEEQLGVGQPSVVVMGKDLRVLKRWGYEWKKPEAAEDPSSQESVVTDGQLKVKREKADEEGVAEDHTEQPTPYSEDKPALWALDLEALRTSNSTAPALANAKTNTHSHLPIYTPQGARAYLLKSFGTPVPADGVSAKRSSAATKVADRERNLGMLLQALSMVYDSWAVALEPEELDRLTWGWYVKVRPAVEHGVAGWGGKNQVKLADVLALRRAA